MRSLPEQRRNEIERYIKLYEGKHKKSSGKKVEYGLAINRQVADARFIAEICQSHHLKSVLDVGCGRGSMMDHLQIMMPDLEVWGAEVVPALTGHKIDLIPGGHELPYGDNAIDLVCGLDLMEHILEDDVPGVLKEFQRVSDRMVYLHISHRDSVWDGRSLHVTLKPPDWWEHMLTYQELRMVSLRENGKRGSSYWLLEH